MDEELTIESLAQELAQADKPEQPNKDSSPAEQQAAEEDSPDEGPLDADQAESEGQDDQPAQPESPAERVIEWTTASGEKHTVSEDELKNGYLRQQDYTVKAQTLAEDRRQAETRVQENAQLVAALASDIGEVRSLESQLAQYQNVDWNALQQSDPVQANTLMTRQLLLRQAVQEAQGKVQAKAQRLDADRQHSFAAQSSEALEHLKTRIPNFGQQTLVDLREACVKAGYNAADLGRISDKTLLHDLWKARQWDALQMKKPEALSRTKGLPPPAKAPVRQATPTSKAQDVTRALNLRKSFSPREFASLLKNSS